MQKQLYLRPVLPNGRCLQDWEVVIGARSHTGAKQLKGRVGEMINRNWLSSRALLGRVLTTLLIAVIPTVGQQQQPMAGASSVGPTKNGDQNNPDQKANENTGSGTSNDRLFYTLPNFLTVQNVEPLPPLTPGQKFKVVARSSFDYVEYPWYGILAGIGQAENSEPSYGQGAAGYAKRYGTAFADGTIENFMTAAVLPSLLRQDPRFYQSGTGSFWRRTRYAISRIFITFTDTGQEQFNYSEIVGSALAAGISTYSYHPDNERTLGNTASVWGTQVGYDTLTIVVKEFWPDVRRKVSQIRQPATP